MIIFIITLIVSILLLLVIHFWYTKNYQQNLLPSSPLIISIQIIGIIYVVEICVMLFLSIINRHEIIFWESLIDAVLLSLISAPLIFFLRIRPEIEMQSLNMHLITDNVVNGIISINEKGLINYLNPQAEKIFGYQPGELINQSVNILMPQPYDSEHDVYIQNYIKTNVSHILGMRREVVGKRKDGSLFPMELYVSEIERHNSKIFIAVIHDITDEKKAEDMIKEARDKALQATQAKSEFLANMSHEIRTPMNSTLGAAELLSETSLTKEQQHYVDIFIRSNEHLLDLINDILDLSKIESGYMELENVDFDVYKLCDDLISILGVRAKDKNIYLRYNISPNCPISITGDPHRLNQILINLVGNAIKFTQSGGITVNVDIADTEVKKANRIHLLFTVTDTGIGIPQDKLNSIFHSFSQLDSSTTRKYGGTGLGLAISKKLAEMMNGYIRVESTMGKGSSFYFAAEFGVTAKDAQDTSTDTIKQGISYNELKESLRSKRLDILLVEDSADNREIFILYIKEFGYNIDVAENGEIALDKLRNKEYDIILMDTQMPIMDGYTATRLYREWESEHRQIKTPIIGLSANALKDDEQKALEAGCTIYLSKPIKKFQLLSAINELTK